MTQEKIREAVAEWLLLRDMAGIPCWADANETTRDKYRREADFLLTLIHELGYRRLDENQEFPYTVTSYASNLRKSGFRRVR